MPGCAYLVPCGWSGREPPGRERGNVLMGPGLWPPIRGLVEIGRVGIIGIVGIGKRRSAGGRGGKDGVGGPVCARCCGWGLALVTRVRWKVGRGTDAALGFVCPLDCSS